MTGSEKFDKVTALIESEIKKDKPPSDISVSVAKEIGIGERDLSTVFTFFTGRALIPYIKERKMNACYEYIIESDEFNAQEAVRLSGLGDQSAFNKKIKCTYGMTPKEAHEKKDRSLLRVRVSWSDTSHMEIQNVTSEEDASGGAGDIIFGVTREKYNEIKEIIELRELYGFDELQSEIAYYIHKTYGSPLKETFRYVDEYEYNEKPEEDEDIDQELADLFEVSDDYQVISGVDTEQKLKNFFGLPDDYQFAPEEDEEPRMTRTEYYNYFVKGNADNPEIRYAYFDVGVNSIYAIYHLIDKLHALGDNDITELPPELIKICANDDLDARYCKKAVDYYLKHATDEYGDDAFDEYVEYILEGQYIENAFANIWHTEGWDDYDIY